MKKIKLTPENIDSTAEELKNVLLQPGGVALVPTETVYGLVARAGDEQAFQRIYKLKHRNSLKCLGWFVGNWRELSDYGVELAGLPEKLAEKYCPGPLTIIAPCKDGSTLGFRVPDNKLLLSLLNKIDVPLVQTSANASGLPDASDCQEALEQLDGEVDCAVDGGEITGLIAGSTVVDATGDRIKILRQGILNLDNWL